ncbi:homoserine dehydrogenase [Thermococcus sp.]
MKTISLSFIGFGNIGRGVARILMNKKQLFKEKYGIEFRVISITDSSATIWDEEINLEEAIMIKENLGALSGWTNEYEVFDFRPIDVVREVDSDIVIDVTNDPNAHIWHLQALREGRNIVTSNKPPLAFHYWELIHEAGKRGLSYKFEATVMAGTPIITLLQESLKGDSIEKIEGVFNGTTTFILSEMEKGINFEEALRKAQKLGIAERDPSGDINGVDAGYKATILHCVAFHPITFREIKIKGIDEITEKEVQQFLGRKQVIRLIAKVEEGNVSVEPMTIPKSSPLAVYGTSNVAIIKGDLGGEIVLKGAGAGIKETASAVVSDIIRTCLTLKNKT